MAEAHDDYWETKDLTTAAYLRCRGIRFIDTRREDGDCVWRFVKSEQLTEYLVQLAVGDAKVDPEEMVKTYMGLRRIMFQTLDAGEDEAGTESGVEPGTPTGAYGRIT